MTKDELKAWRFSHEAEKDRSQTAAARRLRTPLRTYVGWERGESRIPGAVSAFIKLDYETRAKK